MAIAELPSQKKAALKFLDKPIKADAVTDIIYMMCPMHLLMLEEKMKEVKTGHVLAILTDYDGALEDIPEWCNKTGNEFLGVREDTDHYSFYVRKIRE